MFLKALSTPTFVEISPLRGLIVAAPLFNQLHSLDDVRCLLGATGLEAEEEEEEEAPRVNAGLDELLGAAALAEASGATPDELRGPGAAAALRRRARGVVERCLLSH